MVLGCNLTTAFIDKEDSSRGLRLRGLRKDLVSKKFLLIPQRLRRGRGLPEACWGLVASSWKLPPNLV